MAEPGPRPASPELELVDYRRRVAGLYRLSGSGEEVCAEFRRERDRLFGTHPQSALPPEDRGGFKGLDYFPYDPRYRVTTRLQGPAEPGELEIETGGEDGIMRYRRTGTVEVSLPEGVAQLSIYWLEAYGGGLFLAFRDATSGSLTYGGGRYLFDTIKGTDGLCLELGSSPGELTLDFNYAYNPSCAYDSRWACPLPPRENWLSFPVSAGEKAYSGS